MSTIDRPERPNPSAQHERAPVSVAATGTQISAVYRRRIWVNRFNLLMSLCTMAFGMAFLAWILPKPQGPVDMSQVH